MGRRTPIVAVSKEYWKISPQPSSRQGIYEESASQIYPIGYPLDLGDGRRFRYCKVGATALDVGKMCVAATPATDHLKDLAVAAAAAVGATSVSVTNGATTAITLDMYKEGYMVVNDVDGEGIEYKIKGCTAAAVNVASTIYLYDPIQTALTTNSQVGLWHNPWNLVVQNTTYAGNPVGVAKKAITAAYYGWLQTRGFCTIWRGDTAARGSWLTHGGAAGKAIGETATNNLTITVPLIGFSLTAGVDTEYLPIWLQLE